MRLPALLDRLGFALTVLLAPVRCALSLWEIEAEARARSFTLMRSAGADRWSRRFVPQTYIRRVRDGIRERLLGRGRRRYVVRQKQPTTLAGRPRILHAIPNVYVGGSTQLVVDLHEHLGHRLDMSVLTSAVPAGGRHDGMVIHLLPAGTPDETFAHVMREARPDLVHVHYWGDVDLPWYRQVFASAFEAGAEVVQNVNTPIEPFRDPRIARTVLVSDYVKRAFAPDLADAIVIEPGVELERFRPPTTWDDGAFDSLGMIYRLHTDKLDETSIDALLIVAQRRPRTRIFVVGDGMLFEPFRARVRAARLARNFVFTGEVRFDALPGLYRCFRTFVAPVVRESFGQVVPMAMAMGLAVAGNRVGALPDILGSDEMLGGSAEELAVILLKLLADPDRIEQLGQRNLDRSGRFAVSTMIARYANVYADVLGKNLDPMPEFPPSRTFFGI